jgi:hypothetical protein
MKFLMRGLVTSSENVGNIYMLSIYDEWLISKVKICRLSIEMKSIVYYYLKHKLRLSYVIKPNKNIVIKAQKRGEGTLLGIL